MANNAINEQVLLSKRAAALAELTQRLRPRRLGESMVAQNQGPEEERTSNWSPSMMEKHGGNLDATYFRLPVLDLKLKNCLDGREEYSTADGVGSGKKNSCEKSLTSEIDGLLAEEKAAANIPTSRAIDASEGEAPLNDPTTSITWGDNTLKSLPDSNGTRKELGIESSFSPKSNAMPVERLPATLQIHSELSGGEIPMALSAQNQLDNRQVQQPDQHREIQLQEPPKRIPVGPKNQIPLYRKPYLSGQGTTESTKLSPPRVQEQLASEFDNEFSQLKRDEVEDIREWLQFTGYYDEEYRSKTLQRRRRLAALEQEMAELMKEEQHEREAMARRNDSSLPSYTKLTTVDAGVVVTSARETAAANSSIQSSVRTPKRSDTLNTAVSLQSNGKPAGDTQTGSAPGPFIHPSRETNLKRDLPIQRTPQAESAKRLRLENWERNGEDQNDIASVNSIDPSQSTSSEQTRPNPQKNDFNSSSRLAGRGDVTSHRSYPRGVPSRGRGSIQLRSRGRARYSGAVPPQAAHKILSSQSTRSQYMTENSSLVLDVKETRFFMMKSLSFENVMASQHEGIWLTQMKNVDKLAEAFNSSRHVILLYSVNNSKAFQGYARMETGPGDPSISMPQWADGPKWEASPPFKVKWVNTAVTYFKHVSHLTNSYNDNALALVGRDGQEIEPHCGMELCSILDRFEKLNL